MKKISYEITLEFTGYKVLHYFTWEVVIVTPFIPLIKQGSFSEKLLTNFLWVLDFYRLFRGDHIKEGQYLS